VTAFDDGVLHVDFDRQEVLVEGRPIALNSTEYRLLTTLTRHEGKALSSGQLLGLASDGLSAGRLKYVFIRLNRKLGWDWDDSPIELVRGFGYRYRSRSERAPLPTALRNLASTRGCTTAKVPNVSPGADGDWGAPSVPLPGRQPDNVGEPRFGGRSAEAGVDFEAVGSERLDAPARVERSAQLNFGDATGPPVAGLTVAEAHEMKVTAWT
jgi:DNA-binding winged helix-turn-helix (wHTH) protein